MHIHKQRPDRDLSNDDFIYLFDGLVFSSLHAKVLQKVSIYTANNAVE